MKGIFCIFLEDIRQIGRKVMYVKIAHNLILPIIC